VVALYFPLLLYALQVHHRWQMPLPFQELRLTLIASCRPSRPSTNRARAPSMQVAAEALLQQQQVALGGAAEVAVNGHSHEVGWQDTRPGHWLELFLARGLGGYGAMGKRHLGPLKQQCRMGSHPPPAHHIESWHGDTRKHPLLQLASHIPILHPSLCACHPACEQPE
jgi:hypothetical protein